MMPETPSRINRFPFLLLTFYLLLIYFEPQQFFPALKGIRLTYFFGVPCLLWLIISSPLETKRNLAGSRIFWLVVILVIYCVLSTFLGEFPVNKQYETLIKTFCLFLMVCFVLRDESDLFKLSWVLILFTTVNAAVTMYYYHAGVLPTRMASYFGSLGQSGSNEFALLMVQMMPFPLIMLHHAKSKPTRVFLVLSLLIYMYCLTRTQSRSGFLGACVVLISLGILKYFTRKAIFGLCIIISILLFKTPSFYLERMQTITQADVVQQDSNVASRIRIYHKALEIIKRRPFWGTGLENSMRYIRLYLYDGRGKIFAIHNTYLQIAAEAGIPALIMFLILVYTSIRRLKLIRKSLLQNGKKPFLIDSVLVGILGYSLVSFFQPVPFNRLLYIFFAVTASSETLFRSNYMAEKDVENSRIENRTDRLEAPREASS